MKGYTLIEVLVSLLLLTLILLGGMSFYFYSDQHTQTALHRRLAVGIAESTMEQIKRNGYASLPEPAPTHGLWQGPLTLNVNQLPAAENIYVYDVDDNGDSLIDYKQVCIEVTWQDPGNSLQQQVKVDSFIAP
ncbi:MAG: hypothetical protein AMJ95_12660 [Omnitrophica WOR_2 bacterium SM23_72]|nr:MAG: hypothetical protein AMJ95_12660 [Omnitrophica WOR_2 bacterium SM23_72]